MNSNKIKKTEEKIKYVFSNKKLIELAFTHSSYANENKLLPEECNERLEFLGDAVLDLVVRGYLYKRFPDFSEGKLTKIKAVLVCEHSLAQKAQQLCLGEFLLLGRGEELTGGRNRSSILADTFESVIGSVYLDGGLAEAEKIIIENIKEDISNIKEKTKSSDSKTQLQEHIQSISKEPIIYKIINESGPDHDKTFEAAVFHNGKVLGTGFGKSKKEAEQNASGNALKIL